LKNFFHLRKEELVRKEIDRREFLKATAATGTALLAGNLLPGASWAQGTAARGSSMFAYVGGYTSKEREGHG
jgi:hypothetical protein